MSYKIERLLGENDEDRTGPCVYEKDGVVFPHLSASINECIEEAVQLAQTTGQKKVLEYGGVRLKVLPTSSVSKLYKAWLGAKYQAKETPTARLINKQPKPALVAAQKPNLVVIENKEESECQRLTIMAQAVLPL